MGALIFTIHPQLVEVLFTSTRRQQVLPVLFMLLAFLLFQKYTAAKKQGSRYSLLFLSVVVYVLAFGAQEISYIFPIMIISYLFIFNEDEGVGLRSRAFYAIKKTLPFVIVAFLAAIIKLLVLKGVGGYVGKSFGFLSAIKAMVKMFFYYLHDLFLPGGFFGYLSPYPGPGEKTIAIILLIAAVALIMINFNVLGRTLSDSRLLYGYVKQLLVLIGAFSLFLLIIYPFYATEINTLIQRAYSSGSPGIIKSVMKISELYPVNYFIFKARDSIVISLSTAVLLSILIIAVINSRNNIKDYLLHTNMGRTIQLMIVWMFLPLIIYFPTLTFFHRGMYFPLIPFSIIISIIVVKLVRDAWPELKKSGTGNYLEKVDLRKLVAASALACLIILISFVPAYPLFHKYDEWRVAGDISSRFYEKFDVIAKGLPPNVEVEFYNLPKTFSAARENFFHGREVAYLTDYSIKSWLNLHYPGNSANIKVKESKNLPDYPADLSLEVQEISENEFRITVGYQY